ncbi:MAG: amino acid ABC transporter permease [Clostridia bacterium]|nr:amino acid ABC transporter permease [Clostridia bacterium]
MEVFQKLWSDIVKLIAEDGSRYLDGAWSTILLAVVATAAGCLIGFICGVIQTIPQSKSDSVFKKVILTVVKAVVRVYVEVFRGTPMILQAVFIFYGVPYFTSALSGGPVNLDMNLAAYLVVSINTGAYMAETVRGGILSIDPGQTEGAQAIGMNHVQTMLNVIIPQTMRNIMPQIGNNLIINIKDTSVMFIIGYTELFAVHKGIVGANYLYFPSAVVTMAVYLFMTVVCSVILRAIENKMDGPANYDVKTTDTLAQTSGTYNFPSRKAKGGKRS